MDTLPYAYPCENRLAAVMNSRTVQKLLEALADKYCSQQQELLSVNAQAVTPTSYPRLYAIVEQCKSRLGIYEQLQVYVTAQLTGINALSVGSDKTPMVLLSTKAAAILPEEELRFMVGHELGHIAQGNLACHSVKGVLDMMKFQDKWSGYFIYEWLEVALNKWHRAAEFTADRAGLICCGKVEIAKAMLLRMTDSEHVNHYNSALSELYKDHPTVEHRIKELEWFAPHSTSFTAVMAESKN